MRKFLSSHGWKESTSLILSTVFTILISSATTTAQQPVSFASEVLPLLQQKCFDCHGDGEQRSSLDLRTRSGALKGGVHGPALVPGSPEESRMARRISGLEEPAMPFGGPPLKPEEISLLKRWISQGAEYTVEPGAAVSAHSNETPSDRKWWSFKKPVETPVPKVTSPRWSKNPIDAFVFRKMQEKGLEPAPPADKAALIRRAYLDLVGLLPDPQEVVAFVNDDSPDAFSRLVDRLLDSPRYGERWGRHWLDVVRYADSGGYEHDYDYPNAWRYRDYVIRSFNQDKPYNRFIMEQLAGDELDDVTYDALIATGFSRVLATVGFREKDNPQYRYYYLDDMIATTSRGLMGVSIDCARCHDHKFDPIKQAEYYQMMAVFFPFVKYDHPLAPAEEVARYEVRKNKVDARIQPLKERIREIEAPYRKIAFGKKLSTFPEEIQIAVHTAEEERTPGQKLLAAQVLYTRGRGGDISELISPEDQAEVEKLKGKIEKLETELPEPLPVAMGIRDGDYRFAPDGLGDEPQPGKGDRQVYDFEGTFIPEPGKPYVPPPAYLLPTADYRNKGPEVEPGFPQELTIGEHPTSRRPANSHKTSGRRRALAAWLIREDHPLTARVMANRIWHHHFGRGIVSTPSNFGQMGQPPSHPELLDWLAIEFMRGGWSIKHMHRLMMNSQAYQMSSSDYAAANARTDPEVAYLWRFHQRRLEAETIRDIVLDASGTLNLKMGGEPFFPPIPAKVRESFNKGKWEMTEEGPDVWRRSIYSYWKRGLRYPMFDVFDLPDLNVTCERRTTTTVPTQALTLLNNDFIFQQAKHFATRVRKEAGKDPAAQVKSAYWLTMSRDPSPAELDRNVAFLRKQTSYHSERDTVADAQLEALSDLCNVVLNLNEFVYIN